MMRKANNTSSNQACFLGELMAITSRAPESLVLNFIGWSTNPNAASADYFPSQTIEPEQSMTLYAVWRHLSKLDKFRSPPSPPPKKEQNGTECGKEVRFAVLRGQFRVCYDTVTKVGRRTSVAEVLFLYPF